jgi:hypothetical protein
MIRVDEMGERAALFAVLLVFAVLAVAVIIFAIVGIGRKSSHNNRTKCRRTCPRGPPATGDICGLCVDVEDVPESYGTTTICLSCIDYRFVESISEILEAEENVHYYDPFSLAGASLGYNQTVYPDWPQTWLDTVGLAKSLHKISQIIVIEHMDCGMYRAIYGANITPEQERVLHVENLQTFKTAMATLEPTLAVRGYLVYLDGSAQRLV